MKSMSLRGQGRPVTGISRGYIRKFQAHGHADWQSPGIAILDSALWCPNRRAAQIPTDLQLIVTDLQEPVGGPNPRTPFRAFTCDDPRTKPPVTDPFRCSVSKPCNMTPGHHATHAHFSFRYAAPAVYVSDLLRNKVNPTPPMSAWHWPAEA